MFLQFLTVVFDLFETFFAIWLLFLTLPNDVMLVDINSAVHRSDPFSGYFERGKIIAPLSQGKTLIRKGAFISTNA